MDAGRRPKTGVRGENVRSFILEKNRLKVSGERFKPDAGVSLMRRLRRLCWCIITKYTLRSCRRLAKGKFENRRFSTRLAGWLDKKGITVAFQSTTTLFFPGRIAKAFSQ